MSFVQVIRPENDAPALLAKAKMWNWNYLEGKLEWPISGIQRAYRPTCPPTVVAPHLTASASDRLPKGTWIPRLDALPLPHLLRATWHLTSSIVVVVLIVISLLQLSHNNQPDLHPRSTRNRRLFRTLLSRLRRNWRGSSTWCWITRCRPTRRLPRFRIHGPAQ